MAYRLRVAIMGFLLGISISFLFWGTPAAQTPTTPETPMSITGIVERQTILAGGIRRLQLRIRGQPSSDRPETAEVATNRASQPIGTVLRVRCAWKVNNVDAQSRGWECFSRDITAVGFERPSRVVTWGENIRGRILQFVRQVFPEPEGSLLLGMVFGLSAGVPRAIADDFRTTGTTHLLVFSGMQFVILISLIERILVAFGIGLLPRSILIIIVVLAILGIVGAGAATVRAAIMAILPLGARLLGRGRARLHTLLLAAGVMVLANPFVLRQVGFQLTMLATAGIIVATPGIAAFLIDCGVGQWLAQSIAVTVSATLFTAPVIMVAFGGGGAWVVLPNVLLEMMSQLILLSGMAFVAVASIAPALAELFAVVPSALVWVAVGIVHWFAMVFSALLLNSPSIAAFSYVLVAALIVWYVRRYPQEARAVAR